MVAGAASRAAVWTEVLDAIVDVAAVGRGVGVLADWLGPLLGVHDRVCRAEHPRAERNVVRTKCSLF